MSFKDSLLFVAMILVVDQVLKIYIKTNFLLGEIDQFEVTSWFRIMLVENEGMAWGAKIPGEYGKLMLTLFRIVAVFGIGYWLYDVCTRQSSKYLTFGVALIFAGALGNIIDSVFYGVLFNDSTYELAVMFSDNPYGKWFHGKVVDMFYFPIIENYPMPEWVPFIGGKTFTFFNAIFNIADVAITTGVGILIVFNKKAFAKRVSIGTHERFE